MAKTAKKSKAKAGRALAPSTIDAAPQVRSVIVDAAGKRWRWVVDNRMRDYGAIDYCRRVIRINREIHKRERELLIDTLLHEELHRLFPYLGGRTICALSRLQLPQLLHR